MTSRTCVSCLRMLSRQSQFIAQSQKPITIASRALTTTCRRPAELPGPNTPPATSIPPVNPKPVKGRTTANVSPTPAEQAAALSQKGGVTGTYTAYGATEKLYKDCARQADYRIPQAGKDDAEVPKTEDGEDLGVGEGWWHTEAALKPTFSSWSQVTMLHIYLLTTRFRCFEPSISRVWQQHIIDHFFYDAENKMVLYHGMAARGTRNKYLKDLFIQWRGLVAAYDEGIAKNDAVLASAVWRNVFKASEDVDIKRLAQIVSYMRRTLAGLEAVDDFNIMTGEIAFGGPASERELVELKSKMMDMPFDKTPGKPVPPQKQK